MTCSRTNISSHSFYCLNDSEYGLMRFAGSRMCSLITLKIECIRSVRVVGLVPVRSRHRSTTQADVMSVSLLQSTLMRAIANEQLDGFPPKSELRTVFVEHDIDASEAETAVVEYVFLDPVLQGGCHFTSDAISPVNCCTWCRRCPCVVFPFQYDLHLQYTLSSYYFHVIMLRRSGAQTCVSAVAKYSAHTSGGGCIQSVTCILILCMNFTHSSFV